MEKIRLGRTELMVTKTSFGALPVQRRTTEDAVRLLRKAYESGINYFDTANMYTDSEEKIGAALSDVRKDIIISTKSGGTDKKTVAEHIELSLNRMKTDYIDLFQFHNPAELPDINDPDGPFAAALEAKKKGYIRHIGITNHRIHIAKAAIESGNFETLQYPFSHVSDMIDIEIAAKCKEADMGFIAMKGLCGGLLTNTELCFAFMQEYDNVVPIWGIQTEEELEDWLDLEARGVRMNDELRAAMEKDRAALAGDFCRGCGYCMPCAVGIEINNAARMAFLLRRSPYKPYMSDEWKKKMHLIDECVNCGLCSSRCPYGLDTPELLRKMLADYDEFYAEHCND